MANAWESAPVIQAQGWKTAPVVSQKYNDVPSDYGTPEPQQSQAEAPESKDNLLGKAAGLVEAPLSVASSVVLSPFAAAYGLTGGNDVREQNRRIDKVMDYAYKPVTHTGRELVNKFAGAVDDSGIQGVAPTSELSIIGAAAQPSMSAIAGTPAVETALNTGNRLITAPGRAATATGRYIGNTAKAAVQPFTVEGQNALAQKIVRNFAEGGPTDINAAEIVPGSSPTLAEATGNAGIAGLQRNVRGIRPNAFADREAQNAEARSAAFDKVAGDTGQLDFYRSSRAQAASDLYGKALDPENQQPLTPYIKGQVTQLLKRPSINEASRQAQKLALERGETPAAEGSLQSLHDVKTALDDKISVAVREGRGGEANALQETKDKLLDVMEKLSPGYGEARATYAAMSQPVNAMETLQGLKLTDDTGKMTLSKVQGAIDGLEKKTNAPGISAAKSVTSEQINTLKAIRDDLLRQRNTGLGKAAGSDTFQNIATDNILATMLPGRLGELAKGKGGTLFGQVGRLAYSGANEAIKNRLADIMLNPELSTGLNSYPAALTRANYPVLNRLAPYLLPPELVTTPNALIQPR